MKMDACATLMTMIWLRLHQPLATVRSHHVMKEVVLDIGSINRHKQTRRYSVRHQLRFIAILHGNASDRQPKSNNKKLSLLHQTTNNAVSPLAINYNYKPSVFTHYVGARHK